jgi:hypothetical protein
MRGLLLLHWLGFASRWQSGRSVVRVEFVVHGRHNREDAVDASVV